MTRIVADITMSLDGFVTGPNAGPGNGLGDGGEALHRWVFAGDPEDDRILKDGTERSGAVVMGRGAASPSREFLIAGHPDVVGPLEELLDELGA